MLSIIVPTLNEEKVIETTLKSIKGLSVVDYELIVSDGASRDNTVKIAQAHAHKVVVHSSRSRQNIAQGRNAGAAAARGDFLVFIDADVTIPQINDFFSRALDLFANDPQLVGLTVFLKVLPQHVTLSDRLFFGLVNRFNQFSNNVLHLGVAAGEFQMIKSGAFARAGGYNHKLVVGEDNDLFARLGKIGRTKVATGLHVYHTSRRAHNVGWPQLLFLWWFNLFFVKIFGRSFSKEWEVVR